MLQTGENYPATPDIARDTYSVCQVLGRVPKQYTTQKPKREALLTVQRLRAVRNPSSVTNYTNSIYEQFYGRTYCTVSNKTRYTVVTSGEREGEG